MAGSIVKTVTMDIVANPGDSRAVLDDLAAKQEELAKPFSMKIVADTAEATGAVDETTEALSNYIDASLRAEEASAKLAEVQADDTKSAGDLTAAMDANAEATVRALDAQIRLTMAEEKAAAGAVEAGDSSEVAGDKQLESGKKGEEGAGLMAGAWDKAKFALLGVAAGLAYGVVKAAGFQSQITMLNTQAGVAKSQLAGLGKGVLDLAGQVGEDPDSLAQALYHVESSFQSVGITAPKALMLVKIAAEGARMGGADLVDVTNALDATMVAKVPGIHSYSEAMGALNAIVGSGDMTMEDLAQAMGSGVMAVAKTYGQSIYQVGAALATLGDNNIRGAKAATDLRMAWQAMLDPIKTGLPLLQSIGISSEKLGDEMTHHGMTAALDTFIEHLKASKVPISDWGQYETDIFGKKAGVGIGILISQYDRLIGKLPDIKKGATDFGTAWDQTDKTLGQQWKELQSGLEALAMTGGEKLLPVVTKIVHGLTDFVEDLEKGKAGALGIAAVIGTVLAGVALEKLSGGLKTAASGFEGLWNAGSKVVSFAGRFLGITKAQTAATDEQTAATEAQAAATDEEAAAQTGADVAMDANPIGVVIIAIAALVFAIVEVVKHWKDFKQWGVDAWHAVRDAAVDAWHFIDDVAIKPQEQAISDLINWFERLESDGEHAFDALVLAAGRDISEVIAWFEKLPGRIVAAISSLELDLFNAGANAIRGLIHGIESMIGSVVSTVSHLASEVSGAFKSVLSIFSPSRVFHQHGMDIAAGLVLGIRDGTPAAIAASERLAAATLGGFGSAAGRGGSGGSGAGLTVNVTFTGLVTDPQKVAREIQTMLLNLKRDRGGKIDTSSGLGLA